MFVIFSDKAIDLDKILTGLKQKRKMSKKHVATLNTSMFALVNSVCPLKNFRSSQQLTGGIVKYR